MTRTTRPVSERTPEGTAYDLAGPPDAPAMVLIHGLGLSRELWQAHLPALAARHRVVAYDLYGHGASAPAPRTASLTVYADQLARLLERLGIARAAIVGFSIGGMIARRVAIDHPARVTALAILHSPHERGADAQAAVEARAAAVRADGPMATMEAALERWFTPEFRAGAPETMARIRRWREAAHPESYADAAWVLAHGVRELTRPHRAIAAPTLVLTAEHDSGSTPAMSRAIAAEIPGAELRILPGLRHLALLEDPGAVTGALVDFLERNQG